MSEETKTPVIDVILGVGGAGGWLCTLRAKTDGNPVILIDGDHVTKGNLSRQFFSMRDLGRPKVEGMDRYLKQNKVDVRGASREYLAIGNAQFEWLLGIADAMRLFACPDNHPARAACLALADARSEAGRATVVAVCGNEYTTASADIYLPDWKDSKLDYRIRYPEVLTSTGGDPLHPPCTGAALESAPQLALYNSLGALAAAWLMDVWTVEEPRHRGSDLHPQIVERLPISINYTGTHCRTTTLKEARDG